MMQARQDFEIFHEPMNAPYDAIHYKEFYEEITETIFAKAKDSNVFVKEAVFSFQEFLTHLTHTGSLLDCLKAVDKSNSAKWEVLNEIQLALRYSIFDALKQSRRLPVCVRRVFNF
ncbi:MAG: hypothetical protein K2X08_00005, partial [Chlamydiales bacterium]|nr:hypothetical protein [Chlamydiales bacterium]